MVRLSNDVRKGLPACFKSLSMTSIFTPLYSNLSGANIAVSTLDLSPLNASAISLPVAGARLRPIMAWPVEIARFLYFADRPI